jgi:hypothetical protein
MLSQDSIVGPLPTVEVPSFSLDSNVVVIGLGILGLIVLFNRGSQKVQKYARKQRARSERRRKLREELRNL